MKRLLIAGIILLAGCSVAASQEPGGAAPAPSPALKNYFVELDRWSAAAKVLKDHPERAAALRKALPEAWPVAARGQYFSVSTGWLREALKSVEEKPALAGSASTEIEQRIAQMRSEAESFESGPSVNEDLARSRLKAIFERAEFREVKESSWLDKVEQRVSAWMDNLLEKLFGGLSRHPNYGRVALWSFVVSLVLLFLILLSRTFFRAGKGTSLDLKGPLRFARGWRDWAGDALAMAGQGNYREAIRLGYWAGIYRLEELGVWQAHRSRTHREYFRMLDAGDAHRTPLAALTSRFEWVWYGGNAATRGDFEYVISQLEELGCNISLRPATGIS